MVVPETPGPRGAPAPPRPPRWFSAEDVLSGRVNLDGYPFRYIYLSSEPSSGVRISIGGRGTVGMLVDTVMSAAEFLESRGWQVVNFEQAGSVVFMRRLLPR